MSPLPDLNAAEAVLLVAMSCLIAAIWHRATSKIVPSLAAAAVFAALGLLSIEWVSQFMTVDETGISRDLLDAKNRAVRQIEQGAFRTTLPLVVTWVTALQAIGFEDVAIRQTLKLWQWSIGVLGFLGLYALLMRVLERPFANLATFTAFLGVMLLLPTNMLALKTWNYDLVSMQASAAALLLCVLALREGSVALATAGVAMGVLGAQEKLSASPFLLMAVGAAVVVSVQAAPPGLAARQAVLTLVRMIAMALLISTTFTLLFAIFHPTFATRAAWLGIGDAFSSWSWPLLKLIMPSVDFLNARASISLSIVILLAGAAYVFGWAYPHMKDRLVRDLRLRPSVVRLSGWVLLAALLAALFGLTQVHAYWWPYEPGSAAYIAGLPRLNGVALHFDQPTLLTHVAAFMTYCYATIFVSLPMVMWIAAFAAGCRLAFRPIAIKPATVTTSALLLIALLFPILSSASLLPIGHRYFNIPILLLAICLVALAIDWMSSASLPLRAPLARLAVPSLLAATAVVTVVELYPFRPLFASSRPIWVSYDHMRVAKAGEVNASWLGWGEEVAVAGATLLAKCERGEVALEPGRTCADLKLHAAYTALWLDPRSSVPIDRIRPGLKDKSLSPLDYYVFNRSSFVQGWNVPSSVAALVVEARSFPMAWVYRGDKLAASGYDFQRLEPAK